MDVKAEAVVGVDAYLEWLKKKGFRSPAVWRLTCSSSKRPIGRDTA